MELNKNELLIENSMRGYPLELEPLSTKGENTKHLRKVYLRTLGSDKIYLANCLLQTFHNLFIVSIKPSAYPFFKGKALIEASIPMDARKSSDSICVRFLAKVETSPNLQKPFDLEGFSLLVVQIDEVNKHLFSRILSPRSDLVGATVEAHMTKETEIRGTHARQSPFSDSSMLPDVSDD